MEESVVKYVIEIARIVFHEFSRPGKAVKLVHLARRNLVAGDFAELVKLVHIYGAEVEEAAYVCLFGEI